jgi:hypothetical protein
VPSTLDKEGQQIHRFQAVFYLNLDKADARMGIGCLDYSM